jgi:hypothetical protein
LSLAEVRVVWAAPLHLNMFRSASALIGRKIRKIIENKKRKINYDDCGHFVDIVTLYVFSFLVEETLFRFTKCRHYLLKVDVALKTWLSGLAFLLCSHTIKLASESFI